jgi:MFS family permease
MSASPGPFTYSPFARFWLARVLTASGFQIQSVAVARQVYRLTGSALGLGLLRSAPAVGALAMSPWLARHPLRRRVGRSMFIAVLVFGLATVGFGLSTSLWWSGLLLAIIPGGVGTLAVAGLWWRWFPELARVDRLGG